MGIKVNDKTRSLSAQRQLTLNQLLKNRSFQRLSSGLRINSAADDAAGLAISSRFTSQFRGINQAIRNAGDGISLAQTADSALGSVTDNLQRIRELSIQASNGILSNADRKSIQGEIDQLTDEIDRISGTTSFNGRRILNGDGSSVTLQVGASSDETVDLPTGDVRASSLGTTPQTTSNTIDASGIEAGELSINGIEIRATQAADDVFSTANSQGSAISVAAAVNDSAAATGVTARVEASSVDGANIDGGQLITNATSDNRLIINGQTITGFEVQAGDAGNALIDAINAVSEETGVRAGRNSSGALELTADDGRNIEIQTTGDAAAITGLSDGIATGRVTLESDRGFEISGTRPQDAGFTAGTIGTNSQTSLRSIDVTSQGGANLAIDTVDRALERVGQQRSRFGALQNRLESTVSNLSNVAVNVAEGQSRIQDADYALEASELLKRQILEQANIAILSQSNNISQNAAIRLLGTQS